MNAFRKSARSMLGVALLCLFSGAASSIVIPVVAKTATFDSEVFVFNHNAFPITVEVRYYEAEGLPLPGQKTCSDLSVAAGETKSFKLTAQCTDPYLATGSHFGLMVLRHKAAIKVASFYGYARVEAVDSLQGFSIEGFPEHVFSGSVASATGLKRDGPATGSYPTRFLTNCFVGSLGDSVNYKVQLFSASGAPLGNPIVDSLQPYQLRRYFDIFNIAGLGATAQYSNVRASFDETNNPLPGLEFTGGNAFFGFCTVQESKDFGADFRIAKSIDASNAAMRKLRCRGTGTLNDYASISGSCVEPLPTPAPLSIASATEMHRWSMFVHHPDSLHCRLLAKEGDTTTLPQLEMRILDPTGAKRAGGAGSVEAYADIESLASRMVVPDGVQAFWSLDVQARGTAVGPFPLAYGIECRSGSGISLSGQPTTLPRETFPQ